MKEKISFFLSFPVNVKELSGESFALVIICKQNFICIKRRVKKWGKNLLIFSILSKKASYITYEGDVFLNKTIKFNNEALFNLQTLNGLIMSTWGMHYDEPEKQIENAFKRGLSDFSHVKNKYDKVFNMKNGPFNYDIKYEKKLLSDLNKTCYKKSTDYF